MSGGTRAGVRGRPGPDRERGTWLHRAPAAPKLVWLIAALATALAASDPVALIALAVAGFALAAAARSARPVVAGFLLVAPLMALIVVLESIAPGACRAGCEALARLGPVTLSDTGLSHGIALAARVAAAEAFAIAILASIRPSELASVLLAVHAPYPVAFTVAMTLRLVPILRDELGTVLAAQRSRGLRARGLRALAPALRPVLRRTVARIRRLSLSLESRGFAAEGPGGGRAGAEGAAGRGERAWIVAGVVAGVAGIAGGLALGPATVLPIPPVPAVVFVAAAAATLVGTVVAGVRAIGRA